MASSEVIQNEEEQSPEIEIKSIEIIDISDESLDQDDSSMIIIEHINIPTDDVEEEQPELEDLKLPPPDTSLIDVTLIDIEPESVGSDHGLLGRGWYRFLQLGDPGLDEAFNWKSPPPPTDEVGIEKYKFLCKELGVIPVGRFMRSLYGSEVDLSYYGLDPRGIQAITEALFRNKTVHTLNLEDNWLIPENAMHLGELLRVSSKLRCVNLTGCRLGVDGAREIKEGLQSAQVLVDLNLSWNDLDDEALTELQEAFMYNYSIKHLNLSHNKLGSGTMSILTPVVKENYMLEHLDLSWNGIYSKLGFKEFFFALIPNLAIKSLNLSWNGLCNKEVALPIMKFLTESEKIEHLDLSWNRLEGMAVRILKVGMMKSVSLRSMKLGNNPILPGEALLLLQAPLSPTSKLELLGLEDIWLFKDSKQILAKIERNSECKVQIGGIYSDFVINGPNERKLLFARAKFEAQKPKKKKKKRDFGHFILQLEQNENQSIPKPEFVGMVHKAKVKLDENLVAEIMKNFPGEKKLVDLQAMRENYMTLWPDTTLPPPKPKKKRGKSKNKKKDAKSKK